MRNLQTNEEKKDFVKWLCDEKGYSPRGAKDVVSRLNRAERILPLDCENLDDYMYLLRKQNAFEELSPSIQAQIKLSAKLLFQYNDSH